MRKLNSWTSLAGLALVFAVAGCDKRQDNADLPAGSDSSKIGQAMVRVINASPDVRAVNVLADDADTFTAVEFKTVTAYQAVNDNFVTFKLKKADATATDSTGPVAENREMLDNGEHYTLVVVPGEKIEDNPTLMVLEEPSEPADSGKARIRVVNAARGLGEFDVFVPGEKDALIGDVDFDNAAGYQEIDAQSTALQIRVKNSPRILVDVPSRSWEAGGSYTVVMTNRTATERGLEAIVLEDTPEHHSD